MEKWKKYASYGTGQSFNSNGDAFMTIALSDSSYIKNEL